jgi:hypothetical protein
VHLTPRADPDRHYLGVTGHSYRPGMRLDRIRLGSLVLSAVVGLAGCASATGGKGAATGSSATGSSATGSAPGAGARSGVRPVTASSCRQSGTAIPAGRFTGPIKARLTTRMHLSLGGASVPNAGGGTEALTGSIALTSDGRTVTGTITLTGLGLSQVGLPGAAHVHSVDNGELTATISGPAGAPTVTGTLSGEWASLDAPVINGHGSATNHVRAGLHVTHATCAAITGDAIAMFAQIAAPVAQYLSIGGSGTWSATRR